jgi:kynurenine formamidase
VSDERRPYPETDFRSVGQRVSNWGRWSAEDERGTLNLLTPERIVAAAQLIKHGRGFSLGIPLSANGPQPAGSGRPNPQRYMRMTGHESHYPGALRVADDVVFMPLQAASQYDALAHVHYDEALYNGFPASSLSSAGAERGSIDKVGANVAGRGVLRDVARLHGVDWLEHGYAIMPKDLDAAASRQAVAVSPGDILLVRTGWWSMYLQNRDRGAFFRAEPGLGLDCAEWLHAHDVALLGCDNWGVEVLPGEIDRETLPLHMVCLRDMGLTFAELLNLEELASDCAGDGVWEFFFAGPALEFTGGLGTPINPLALK